MLLYRINRLLLVGIMAAYAPLILATVALMCWGAFRLSIFAFSRGASPGGRILPLVAIFVDLTVLGVSLLLLVGLLPLLFKRLQPETDGIKLLPRDHPTLFELLGRFCKRLKTPMPDAVYLTAFDEMMIGDLTIVGPDGKRRKNERTLVLGAAFLVHLRADEFGTILCHEMAHAAAGDTWFGRVTARFFDAMQTAIGIQADEPERTMTDWAMYLALLGYYRLFTFFYAIDSRALEYRADHNSATVCGPRSVANALFKIYLTSHLTDLSIFSLFIEYSENDLEVSNIYEEHRQRWQNLPEKKMKRARHEILNEKPSALDTHPSLARRIKALESVKTKEWKVNKPATALFTNWAKLEERITNALIKWGRKRFGDYLDRLDREIRHRP